MSDFALNFINPLITAATPLISKITLLQQSPPSGREIPTILKRCKKTVDRFIETAETLGFDAQTIADARFCLSATADDIVANASWGKQSSWAKKGLVADCLASGLNPEEDLYDLLSRHLINPTEHSQSLLALGYYCFCLGFYGIYRGKSHQAARQLIVRQVYQAIEADITESPPVETTLYLKHTPRETKETKETRKHRFRRLPVWIASGITILSAVVIYVHYEQKLTHSAIALIQNIKQLHNTNPPTMTDHE